MIPHMNQRSDTERFSARSREPRIMRALVLTLALLLVGGWSLVQLNLASTQILTATATRVATLGNGVSHSTICVHSRCAIGMLPHASAYPSPMPWALPWRYQAQPDSSLGWYFTAALTIALLCLALASVYGDAARRIGRARGSPATYSPRPLIECLCSSWLPIERQDVNLGVLTMRRWRYHHIFALVAAHMRGLHAHAVEIWDSGTAFSPRRGQQAVRIGVCETRMNAGM